MSCYIELRSLKSSHLTYHDKLKRWEEKILFLLYR